MTEERYYELLCRAEDSRDAAEARALKYEQALRDIVDTCEPGYWTAIARAALDKPGTEAEKEKT